MSADFVDSNVLVYLFDRGDDRRHGIAEALVARGPTQSAVISYQVVQETSNVLTRKIKPAMTRHDAQAVLDDVLAPMWRVQPSQALYSKALDVRSRLGFGFSDSLIVAAALEADCKRLLTEDLQHGQRVGGLRIENPFLAT
jgi:predicted nucleic acid-binding protein